MSAIKACPGKRNEARNHAKTNARLIKELCEAVLGRVGKRVYNYHLPKGARLHSSPLAPLSARASAAMPFPERPAYSLAKRHALILLQDESECVVFHEKT